eukprot:1158032-Pelagomonas_calceolata.AAC.3
MGAQHTTQHRPPSTSCKHWRVSIGAPQHWCVSSCAVFSHMLHGNGCTAYHAALSSQHILQALVRMLWRVSSCVVLSHMLPGNGCTSYHAASSSQYFLSALVPSASAHVQSWCICCLVVNAQHTMQL